MMNKQQQGFLSYSYFSSDSQVVLMPPFNQWQLPLSSTVAIGYKAGNRSPIIRTPIQDTAPVAPFTNLV